MRALLIPGLAALLLALPATAAAQDDGWRFVVNPYVLLPSMKVTCPHS